MSTSERERREHGQRSQRDDAVAATAARLAADVLADAVPEARRRARERLVDLLADKIVDAASRRCAPVVREPPAEGLPADEGEADEGEALYVYAVTRSAVPLPAVVGLDGRTRVARVAYRDVGLIVSRVPTELLHGLDEEPVTEDSRLARLARRHDAVVTAAFGQAVVLPLRFGTLLRDEWAAQGLVTSRYAMLDKQLGHLAGCAEYGLRVLDEGGPPTPAPQSTAGDEDDQGRGTAYLTRRRDELAARNRRHRQVADLVDAVVRRLGAHAVETVSPGHTRQHDGVLHEAAYLVAGERRGAFLKAADEASDELTSTGFRVDVQGPWPPYSFARVELTSEGSPA